MRVVANCIARVYFRTKCITTGLSFYEKGCIRVRFKSMKGNSDRTLRNRIPDMYKFAKYSRAHTTLRFT